MLSVCSYIDDYYIKSAASCLLLINDKTMSYNLYCYIYALSGLGFSQAYLIDENNAEIIGIAHTDGDNQDIKFPKFSEELFTNKECYIIRYASVIYFIGKVTAR